MKIKIIYINCICEFTKYNKNLRNIMLTNLAVCKTYEIFCAKIYANLQNITNIYEILRLHIQWFKNLRNLSCENLRKFMKYNEYLQNITLMHSVV